MLVTVQNGAFIGNRRQIIIRSDNKHKFAVIPEAAGAVAIVL